MAIALGIIAIGGVFTVQQKRIANLSAENEQHQAELVAALAQQSNAPLSESDNVSKAEVAGEQQSIENQKARLELLRLRNEAAQLRDENERLRQTLLESTRSVAQLGAALAQPKPPPPNAWIGVNVTVRPAESGTGPDQLVVGGVAPNSPADEAKLEEGDVLVGADGVALTNVSQFIGVVTNGTPGQALLVDFLRQDSPMRVWVVRAQPPQ